MKKPTTKQINQLCQQESENYALTRSKERQAELGEVFTPTNLVLEILRKLPQGQKTGIWQEGYTVLDPACGNGQFLAPMLIIKNALNHANPISTIYGVDIMEDNVKECRERLLKIVGDTVDNRFWVERNIVCADGLTYDYEFNCPYAELKWKNGRITKVNIMVEDLDDNFKLIKPLNENDYDRLKNYAESKDFFDYFEDENKYENKLKWPSKDIIFE